MVHQGNKKANRTVDTQIIRNSLSFAELLVTSVGKDSKLSVVWSDSLLMLPSIIAFYVQLLVSARFCWVWRKAAKYIHSASSLSSLWCWALCLSSSDDGVLQPLPWAANCGTWAELQWACKQPLLGQQLGWRKWQTYGLKESQAEQWNKQPSKWIWPHFLHNALMLHITPEKHRKNRITWYNKNLTVPTDTAKCFIQITYPTVQQLK